MFEAQKKMKSFLQQDQGELEVLHTLSIIVENEPGALARVTGLFSARGYNIESLTVSEVERCCHQSRITIVTKEKPSIVVKIMHQIERILSVYQVTNLTEEARQQGYEYPIEREIALVKVKPQEKDRVQVLHLISAFKAEIVDANAQYFIVEVTGTSRQIQQFVSLLEPLGLVEMCRSGLIALAPGVK